MLSNGCLSFPVLSCPVCLSVCVSVMFVHCDQTVGRIKMKLGTQVGLGPGHIVLGVGTQLLLPQKGHSPQNFRPMLPSCHGKSSVGSSAVLVGALPLSGSSALRETRFPMVDLELCRAIG